MMYNPAIGLVVHLQYSANELEKFKNIKMFQGDLAFPPSYANRSIQQDMVSDDVATIFEKKIHINKHLACAFDPTFL